jgi:hypothetical protein
MNLMNFKSHDGSSCHRASSRSPLPSADARPSFFGRVYAAIMKTREADAQRQMARLLRQSGGRLTDDMERRFSEHLLGGGNFRLN